MISFIYFIAHVVQFPCMKSLSIPSMPHSYEFVYTTTNQYTAVPQVSITMWTTFHPGFTCISFILSIYLCAYILSYNQKRKFSTSVPCSLFLFFLYNTTNIVSERA